MKLNTDKCYVLLNSRRPNTIKIGNLCVKNFSCEKMLGINFNYTLKFTNHIDEIWHHENWMHSLESSEIMRDMVSILTTTSFTGYDNDNTSFVVRDNTTNAIKALGEIVENHTKWFWVN